MQKKSFLINNKGDSMETRGRKAFKRANMSNPEVITIKFIADKTIQEKLESKAMSEHRSITQQANLFLIQCIKNYQIND